VSLHILVLAVHICGHPQWRLLVCKGFYWLYPQFAFVKGCLPAVIIHQQACGAGALTSGELPAAGLYGAAQQVYGFMPGKAGAPGKTNTA
jgi:hypothetical protein